jgi:hypothetical protein
MNPESVIREAMQSQLPAVTLPSAKLLLSGAVGSTLNGIDKEHSDVDRMAVYAYSAETIIRSLVGVSNIKESFFNSDPDVFGYDSGRVTEILMKSNAPLLNFLHSDSFEYATPLGLEIAELTKSRLLTLDGLFRVIPASAKASYNDSLHNANRGNMDFSLKISQTPKNVARKLKVGLVQLAQARQALDTGVYRTQVPNPDFFRSDYPDMTYDSATDYFIEQHDAIKKLASESKPADFNFKAMYNEEDVELMRDWVVATRSL